MSMTDDLPEPARWSDSPPQGERSETAEHAIGAALRRVREATLPSDTALARAARRVNAVAAPRTRGQLIWRLVVTAALIMATGGAVGAALNRWRRVNADAPAGVAPGANGPAATKRARRRGRHGVQAALPSPQTADLELPAEEPVPEFPAAPQPPAPVLASPTADVPAPASAGPTGVAALAAQPARPAHESHARPAERRTEDAAVSVGAELVANAFRDLRSRGDAAGALQALDDYDRRFPNGVLRSESRVARVEALLTLDRRKEALRLLETADGGGALTRDVRVTRGELRAESNRCAEALRDFDAVLAARDGDAAGGRALYGRAGCRLRAGDNQGARRDLTRYLDVHADGPSAEAARRALAVLP